MQRLAPDIIIQGPFFPEPIQIVRIDRVGDSLKIIGIGLKTNQSYKPILTQHQLSQITILSQTKYDGDSSRFRLGIEALRLGLAFEYDPYFSLSIARVDPLPHQLEAVYEYFLKLPRIRFLLADDPGAGKTIMAGLLLKELKIRGLAKRTLIVTPANLTFQWQREMRDKFRESFEVISGSVLRANYGSNPWQEKNQVITSVSWISRIEDANESLKRSHWDLIIVDEAHKMSAYSVEKKTLAYQLGEELSKISDHFLMMTATPHKGDPTNFSLFLSLLDRDVYGDVKSLEEAMRRQEAPFYLRRIKEALVTFPDPDTGETRRIFTNRNVDTIEFYLDDEEGDFYFDLTHYVEDQSIKASLDNTARGRALGFTMAMLQRRFASSLYAVRRSLERMKDKREKILSDPETYRQEQILKKIPDDFEDLPEDEQQEIMLELEEVVASIDPRALREEIFELSRLIEKAKILEQREVESKLIKLREVLTHHDVFKDPKMKLIIFTEHKDTLDYLEGKLRQWGLSVTKIHGGMKIGDRDATGTRIYAEREFKEEKQILIATEAAGEGINLQFCWFMINYDIPWNPVRLEQRMGRIHRYGQEKDCLILNFVSTNTREGRVLQVLFERLKQIESDLDPKQTGKIFNVLGDVFPSNQLERMVRDMYSRNLTEQAIKDRILQEIDADQFKKITNSTLEGLAKRDLNLSALIGKSAEARERRLVPEVVQDFFLKAAPMVGVRPKEVKELVNGYRIGRIPRSLWATGEQLESRFGKLGKEYKLIVFDKKALQEDPTAEWVTPGHPLFESIREDVLELAIPDLRSGSVFFDLHTDVPYHLDVFSVSIKDGAQHLLHQKLYVVQSTSDGVQQMKQPTIFLDLIHTSAPSPLPDRAGDPSASEHFLITNGIQEYLEEITSNRSREVGVIKNHLRISLNAIIDKVQLQCSALLQQKEEGSMEAGLDGRIKQFEERLDELSERLERRLDELQRESECMIGAIDYVGSAWVLPHPERKKPELRDLVKDDEIERRAIGAVIAAEASAGWSVESVERDNRGFDLISRRFHPEDTKTAIEIKFIEVKGRAHIGEVLLTTNEFKTAERLKDDYWLYVVYNCTTNPEIHRIQNPARMDWKPLVKIEHYHVNSQSIISSSTRQKDFDEE